MHGSVDVVSGSELLKVGMVEVAPQTYLDESGNKFQFNAVEITLVGQIYVNRINDGFHVQHTFIVEAAERLKLDIYQNICEVVFSTEFLDSTDLRNIPRLHLSYIHNWACSSA